MFGFVSCHFDGRIDDRLVLDDAIDFDAAGGGQQHFRSCVVETHRQFRRGKAAEHDRMHGAQASAGQHRNQRLRDHRQVDDDAVSFFDAMVFQQTGTARHLVAQFAKAEFFLLTGDRGIVDQRSLLAAAVVDMKIQRQVAGVQFAVREPVFDTVLIGRQYRVGGLVPVEFGCFFCPERLRIFNRCLILFGITH